MPKTAGIASCLEGRERMKDTRVIFWDNIKGLLILLVVFAHCLWGLQNQHWNNVIVDSIYYFHMPAFVFVSGYFSKSERSRSIESLLRLSVLYLIMHLSFSVLALARGEDIHLFSAYYSEWYLIALVVWRLITPQFINTWRSVLLVLAISLIAGWVPALGGNALFSVNKIVTFWPFFCMGYLLPKELVDKCRSSRYRVLFGIICAVIVLVLEKVTHHGLMIADADLLPGLYALDNNNIGLIKRVAVFSVASLTILALVLLAPSRKLPLITRAGQNSLYIYALHRPITLLFTSMVLSRGVRFQLLTAMAATIVMSYAFSMPFVADGIDRLVNSVVNAIKERPTSRSAGQKTAMGFTLVFVVMLLLIPYVSVIQRASKNATISSDAKEVNTEDIVNEDEGGKEGEPIVNPVVKYRTMSAAESQRRSQAYRILFAGDLILLEDQVRRGYGENGYQYDDCFEWTKDYIESADLAIGVFEGPCGGTEKGYSSSNLDDGKELWVNYPDEWALSVQRAGFDVVSTANNHALDAGENGLLRSLAVLDDVGIEHIGTYENEQDKRENRVLLINQNGIKLAILGYTYGVNGYTVEQLMSPEMSWMTSIIVAPDDSCYNDTLLQVKEDFDYAKSLEPDLIVVLPHWGEQFHEKPDAFQLAWQKTFLELGADIILGDHTHGVQPVTIDAAGHKRTLTVFCPSHYANIYREHNGDASALVEIYIDRESKEVIGGSIIPMWIASSLGGNYRPLPLWDATNDDRLSNQVTTYDYNRMCEVHKIITRVMLGQEMPIDMCRKRLHFDERGFLRELSEHVDVSNDMKAGTPFRQIAEAESICFVGDSVTEGTMNGGVPWYEPLLGIIHGDVTNCGWGSSTIKTLISDHSDEIVDAGSSLYVVAIGTNDVRYRDATRCAMNPDEYIACLSQLRSMILHANPDAQFIFVAPWTSTDGDSVSQLPYREKCLMNSAYSKALEDWCDGGAGLYVDANRSIDEIVTRFPQDMYMLDAIHPNSTKGVMLYSEAFLLG